MTGVLEVFDAFGVVIFEAEAHVALEGAKIDFPTAPGGRLTMLWSKEEAPVGWATMIDWRSPFYVGRLHKSYVVQCSG